MKILLTGLCTGIAAFCAAAAVPEVGLPADTTSYGPLYTATFDTGVAMSEDSATVVRLSREECIAIALQDNPDIRVADLEIKRMDYSKREVQASLFPQIDFSGSYQRAIELQTIRMNMGGQSQSMKMGSDNTWNLGFNAQMPLVNTTLWKTIQISDIQILAALEQSRASRLDLIDQVNQAYYAMLLAIASREVIRQNYDIAVFNAGLYEKQFQAGTATEYDVLRSSVAVTNIEPELLEADIAVKRCKLQLKVLMGIDAAVDVEPTVTLAEMQREMYDYTLQAGRSLAGNTQLRQLDLQRDVLSKTVTMRKLAWVPTLGASFNISWLSLSNGSPFRNQEFNPYSTFGLSLNVPIFAGGSRYNALRQAQVQLAEIGFQRENLVNSLNMQIELALDNIRREARQIATNEQGMKQARKARDIMQKSFEIGAATFVDLRDSELANTTAQLAYYQAIYNFLISSSELDRLLGKGVEVQGR